MFLWILLVFAGGLIALVSFPFYALADFIKTIIQQIEFIILCLFILYTYSSKILNARSFRNIYWHITCYYYFI